MLPAPLCFCSFGASANIILSKLFAFVNSFFNFFQLLTFARFDKRRRRDLNPRAAINDLHPFQGCPFGQLGYFSTARIIGLFNCVVKVNGEGGIRTHAPLRTNGFQDRLVMTTSIPLHAFLLFLLTASISSARFIIAISPFSVNNFFSFFLTFFLTFLFLQERPRNFKVFRSCNLNILIGTFH